MNIFEIHRNIIDDYKEYIESFINIKDTRIKQIIENEMSKGVLCPEPLIQFNPSFKFDKNLEELCEDGVLHQKLNKVFAGYKLYKHQVDALELGAANEDFVVTSGTGSGKSLTYIGTIFNSILRGNTEKGIKAIIVYPMNALINSQTEELNKFKENFGDNFPITFRQYTGQESQEARAEIQRNPPDILLTNYMMLELIMTRATEQDKTIRNSIQKNLKTIIFDEMHTYKGRQGADVAMLIRRIKAFVKNELQCIGTSATMSSGTGTELEQKSEVADVASKLFGTKFKPKQIISETLTRVTNWNGVLPNQLTLAKSVQENININDNEDKLRNNPIAIWLENRIGLEEVGSWLKRRMPVTFLDIIEQLALDSGLEAGKCEQQLSKLLKWASKINDNLRAKKKRKAYFPFRLHQFISQTGSVFVTLENRSERRIQLNPGYYIKDENEGKQRIYPVVFSRITGHEFICVKKNYYTNNLEPRNFRDAFDEDETTQAGYIIIEDTENAPLWDDTMIENLPDSWYKVLKSGKVRVEKKYRDRVPTRIYFNKYGQFSEKAPINGSDSKLVAWFMPAKLLFDPTCFAFYDLKTSEGAKLMPLGNEGRSTATTVLSLASIKNLRKAKYEPKDQKLLSFTDNRQDASLQAGHFNDFINVGLIRSAIYQAIKDSKEKLTLFNLAYKVVDVLDLPQEFYAQYPAKFGGGKSDNREALTKYITIRILQDLKRGWRYTMPNLEQCALLNISYKYVEDEIDNPEAWNDIPYVRDLDVNERLDFINNTLDFFRTSSAIRHRYFFKEREKVEDEIKTKLKEDWGLAHHENIPDPNYLRYESVGRIYKRGVYTKSIGKLSAWGKYATYILSKDETIKKEDFLDFCKLFFNRLEELRLLKSEELKGEKGLTLGYMLNADVILWEEGDYKTVKRDEVRIRTIDSVKLKPNTYFQKYYKENTKNLRILKSAEHTGQVKHNDRKEREEDFRKGNISTLFCSPTMELGIDISNLNIVHMRNVPPNPANYAQRSGRAGRSGQGALVITYCSQYSPHDRNYFKNKTQMVSGVVLPPRLALENEELIKSHINAMYFLETGLKITKSIRDIIEESSIALQLKHEIELKIKDGHQNRKEIVLGYYKKILQIDSSIASVINLEQAEKIIDNIPNHFDETFERWRRLYKNAIKLRSESRSIIDNPIYALSSNEKKQAERSEKFAKRQLNQLRNEQTSRSNTSFSEFYPFRYLAAEGFLPGYNFTKLPIRAAINGYESAEYISRPRLIAIQEFGPKNIIYHNGESYEINRISIDKIEDNIKQTRAKISTASGYFLIGSEYTRETCPITNRSLSGQEDNIITNLLEMNEVTAKVRQRITSEEEERMRLGYEMHTYFYLPKGTAANDNIVIKHHDDDILKIMFMPTATIVSVNKKWNRSQKSSFLIDKRFGFWKRESDQKKDEEGRILPASLYTEYSADALYIQPMKNLNLDRNQTITLQFAFRRAIEDYFQIESSEIAVTLMGEGEAPNIFIYEAAEGSLGILTQFAKDEKIFREVVSKAYEICHFLDGKDSKPEAGAASYEDLLSYYNQRFHEEIDRHSIRETLEKLRNCTVEIQLKNSGDYDLHYKRLLSSYDTSSSTELKFLKYLYENDLRLPDRTQPKLLEKYGLFIMPDFQYDNNTFIFCDGTPHDDPEIRKRDRKQRKVMRKAGIRYIVYYYKDSLEELIKNNKDIFIKIR